MIKQTRLVIYNDMFTSKIIESNSNSLFVYDTTIKDKYDDVMYDYWNTFSIPTKVDTDTELDEFNLDIVTTILNKKFSDLVTLTNLNIFKDIVFSKYFGNNLSTNSIVYKIIKNILHVNFNINMTDNGLIQADNL